MIISYRVCPRRIVAWVFLAAAGCAGGPPAQPLSPLSIHTVERNLRFIDDIEYVRAYLATERATARADTSRSASGRIMRLIELGLWQDAEDALATTESADVRLAEAELRIRQHRYHQAEALAADVLKTDPQSHWARVLRASLYIRAWELDRAADIAHQLLSENDRDVEAARLRGRIHLLSKEYDQALDWARRIEAWSPGDPRGLTLEADVRFWNQDPEGAVEPLRQALSRAPLDPDLRFNYGYAIWRRVDAAQLDDMAAHWKVALSVHPLHYLTHWHWGNGHTNLTYADYAHDTDSVARARLRVADSLIGVDRTDAAIALTRVVEREVRESVLPAIMRGSAFYMAYDWPFEDRMDSAQTTFNEVLRIKSNYGPAHNGLAAVIKQRQFTYLAGFDSLEAIIQNVPLTPDPNFDSVFPDVAYYPGDRMAKMARSQLGPSLAYLPMLQRFGRQFAIPPLHRDLADAMDSPRFRTTTTFDNRQWMDIRGVGSGAAGVEYVERGGHQERNVLLHEYVHLVHGRVFTDEETRQVRALYYDAMRRGRTLDYYASNNESEFLAQVYPAYLAPVKVHPLNHKSVNTRSDLASRDPATFRFVEELITRQRAFLAGDSLALRRNWAQVFTRLSEQARSQSADDEGTDPTARATALLDTALIWAPEYVPAHLSYAALARDQGDFATADHWLSSAANIDDTYAPLYAARAELVLAKSDTGLIDRESAFIAAVSFYEGALALEADLNERASLNRTLRELYRDHADWPNAIRVAESYAGSAPTVSTYLRNRRDEAQTFAHVLRSQAGYSHDVLDFFDELLIRRPQDYDLRAEYADALARAGQYARAIVILDEGQAILASAGRARTDYMVRTAESWIALAESDRARAVLEPLGSTPHQEAAANRRLLRLLAALDNREVVNQWLGEENAPVSTPSDNADLWFTQGWIAELQGEVDHALSAYQSAVTENPYHIDARIQLVKLLRASGDLAAADAAIAAAFDLALRLGPDFQHRLSQPSAAAMMPNARR